MQTNLSRRRLIVNGCLISAAVLPCAGLIVGTAQAAGLPPLDPADPTAKALGFMADSSKVDGASNPTHTAAQKCGTCAQFQGKTGDASGGCNIFAGKSVPSGGWCKVWAQKPAG